MTNPQHRIHRLEVANSHQNGQYKISPILLAWIHGKQLGLLYRHCSRINYDTGQDPYVQDLRTIGYRWHDFESEEDKTTRTSILKYNRG